MGMFLNSIAPFEEYKRLAKTRFFVDKTDIIREILTAVVEDGQRYFCIKVEVPGNGVLHRGSSHTKFQRSLKVLPIQHTADHAAGKGIAAAHTVNNRMNAVLLGMIELLGIPGINSSEKAQKVMKNLMQYVDVCIGNEEDAELVLGYTGNKCPVSHRTLLYALCLRYTFLKPLPHTRRSH